MAENKEELKSLLMWVKEESKRSSLRLNSKKKKKDLDHKWHLASFTVWQIEGENVKVMTDFFFLGSKITADGDCSYEIRR